MCHLVAVLAKNATGTGVSPILYLWTCSAPCTVCIALDPALRPPWMVHIPESALLKHWANLRVGDVQGQRASPAKEAYPCPKGVPTTSQRARLFGAA